MRRLNAALAAAGAIDLLDPVTGVSAFRGMIPTNRVSALDPDSFIALENQGLGGAWRVAGGVSFGRDTPAADRSRLFMTTAVVPAPAAVALLPTGLFVLAAWARRSRRVQTRAATA